MEVVEGDVVDVRRRDPERCELLLEGREALCDEVAQARSDLRDHAGEEGRRACRVDVGRVEEERLHLAALEELNEHAAMRERHEGGRREGSAPERVPRRICERGQRERADRDATCSVGEALAETVGRVLHRAELRTMTLHRPGIVEDREAFGSGHHSRTR